jgi:SAM-dependent methyltransferase
VEGHTRASYGDAFADVYDDWYAGLDDTGLAVDAVSELAADAAGDGRTPRLLELAVGTGRLAVPLAARGIEVYGVDTSDAMLDRLRDRDPDGHVSLVLGDMVDDMPDGPFDLVLVAYNSLFGLEDAQRQQACFAGVAARLAPRGVFVVEAFVPDDPPRSGSVVAVRSMSNSEVVLSISEHDPEAQTAHGHLVQFADGERVRLRPWAIRYAPPSELDQMAAAAGLRLATRWEDFARHPFGDSSSRHVSVYSLDTTR